MTIHIYSFETCAHLVGRQRTYENIKAAVLAAGRFSIFEATDSRASIKLFRRLEDDPEVETFTMGYPWIGARAR